jgi:Ca-activated chloride channel family protein
VKIDTQLDIDVIAAQAHEQLSLLVELTAPAALPSAAAGERGPRTLVVVLDRSGSMSGSRLDGARRALLDLVDRLDPVDNFGLVTFDNHVQIVVPAGPMADKPAIKQRIAAIHSGGSTDLSSGYLRGIQEATRALGTSDRPGRGATVLLISDGHANAGVTDPTTLGGVAATAAGHRITTTTVGFGLGYDEALLGAIAAGGNGNELFAETADDAVAAIAGELDGLLAQTAQAASVLVRMSPVCRKALVVNELPVTGTADGILVELGGFFAGEVRRMVLTFDVPGIEALGLAEIATLEFSWVELPGLVQQQVSVPVCVNVAPADVAAGRVPDPAVRAELSYLQAQREKRAATEAMTAGDVAGARESLRRAGAFGRMGQAAAPAAMMADFTDDLAMIARLEAELDAGDMRRAAKLASADTSAKYRQRRRPVQPPQAN